MADTGLYVGVYSGGSISWIARYPYGALNQVSVSDGLGSMDDTLSLPMIFPISFVTGGNELPLAGQVVRLVVEDVKLFEGIIPAVNNKWGVNNTVIETAVTAASYASLLNTRLVVKNDAAKQTAGARIRSLLTDFGDVFNDDMKYIKNGLTVPVESYDYQSLASIISKLASMTGYMWYVDFDKRIHFFADLDEDAPITAIDVDTITTIGDIEINNDASSIVNVVIVKDFSSMNPNTENYTAPADGFQSFWGLPMPPFSLENTEVYVKPEGENTSWIQRTLVEDPLDGSTGSIEGSLGMAFLCLFNEGIRFPTSDLPGAGSRIKASYNPEEPERVTVVFDEDSIAEFARREGTDGHHEMVISASDFRVETDEPLLKLGQIVLNRKAWPIISGSFTVYTTNYGEWLPGQTFTIVSINRDIFDVKTWVISDYITKSPVRVWVTSVKRRFEATNDGILEIDSVVFSSVPWS